MNRTDALKILGLYDPACEADIKSAFRSRIKDVHPDINPTSDALLRLMIVARDILLDTPVVNMVPKREADIIPLPITPHQSIHGGNIICEVPANLDVIEQDQTVQSLNHLHRIRIALPKGLRHGEVLRLKDGGLTCGNSKVPGALLFGIDIALDKDTTIAGNDIWIEARIDSEVLKHGGQTTIETPHGPQIIAVKGPFSSGSSLRLKGQGLSSRAGFPAGDLHVRLMARAKPSQPAAELLGRFTQRWG